MDGNIPEPHGRDPFAQYLAKLDLSKPDACHSVFELINAGKLSPPNLKRIFDRIDPNDRGQITSLLGIVDEEILTRLAPGDYDYLASKVNPNNAIGSYFILVFLEQGLLTPRAKAGIVSRIDLESPEIYEKDTDFGSAFENLLGANLISLQKAPTYRYPDFLTDSLGVRFN